MAFSFENKRVLITGAAQGLGSAIVKKFYESGATVFAVDINADLLRTLTQEFPNVTAICADLTKWEEVKKLVDNCGPLDHLINNAGIYLYEPMLNISEKTMDRTFDINFKAPFNLSQEFAKNVISNSTKGATIVNVSSIGDRLACRGSSVYGCSKAALSMMTKCFAVELGDHDIRVNAVAPAGMLTSLYAAMPEEIQKSAASLFQRQPIQRLTETSEVADLIAYLSSPLSKMITGTVVPIDGGMSAA